jgi:hypothetical protein
MERERCNTCAIIGFVMSFYVPIIGIVFSIIGLNQIKKSTETGKGLAIAGIIVSVITILLVLLVIAALFMTSFAL